jgi:hypothetical protein
LERDKLLAAVFAASASIASAIPTVTTAAAATTTTATATAVAATTAAATRTIFTGACFVDGQCAAIDAFAIKGLDGSISAFFILHGDKGETARAAAEFVHDQIDFENSAVRGEHILKLVFGSVEGKISYKQFRAHDDFTILTLTDSPFELFPTIGFQIITEASFN